MSAVRAVVPDDAPHQSPDVDDRELVDRVKRGDAPAYDTLVRRYVRRAMAVARRLLGNTEDAEDLVQDAFIRALDRIHTFDNRRAFGPWFFRLLVNTGLNARKARALRTTEPEQPEAESGEPGPHQRLESKEIRERFIAALESLPPRQRMIVSMFEVDGLSTADIARTLGISEETVRWHHHQARRTLRRTLAGLRN